MGERIGFAGIADAAFNASTTSAAIYQVASTLRDVALTGENSVELEVQLLDRLGEVADRLREVLLVARGGVATGGLGFAPRHEAGVEVGADVHVTAPSGGVPAAGTAGSDETTVGATPGASPSGAPGASSGAVS